ncbi:hypothetical protein AMTR_s04769p00001820 [Amborella trichopoda]|uniref:Uncharacterized protein n=1 Tax=Amborella trichopoda TaxID=13333 RepID=U5D128_AMBTC|nr:hypothetical protein AMTR_s04769p00001820 [Amborella trichopoda]
MPSYFLKSSASSSSVVVYGRLHTKRRPISRTCACSLKSEKMMGFYHHQKPCHQELQGGCPPQFSHAILPRFLMQFPSFGSEILTLGENRAGSGFEFGYSRRHRKKVWSDGRWENMVRGRAVVAAVEKESANVTMLASPSLESKV